MSTFTCPRCSLKPHLLNFDSAIRHCINIHSDSPMQICKRSYSDTCGKPFFSQIDFPIIPNQYLPPSSKYIKIDCKSETVTIEDEEPEFPEIVTSPPNMFTSDTESASEDDENQDLNSALEVLPKVYEQLSPDQTSTFTQFLYMVSAGKFPTTNLSFLCFLDTVKYFGLSCPSLMRFSPAVKNFVLD